jgi:hypothetical protein
MPERGGREKGRRERESEDKTLSFLKGGRERRRERETALEH